MISIKSNISAAICLLVSVSALPAVKIEGDWTLAKSSKAWVITDVSPGVASRAIEKFEIVNDFIGRELGIDAEEKIRDLRPQYVLIPRSRDLFDELAPFQSKHRGSRANGFYIQSDYNPLVLVSGVASSENWETVYHEFTHRILNAHFNALPNWSDEGLAELFSNIRLSKTDAQLTRSHDRTRRYEASISRFIDWDTFFATTQAKLASWIESNGSKAQAYYAQAALLAELTHFGKPELKSGYWELIERSAYKPISELDCQILLGFNYSQLNGEIKKQLHKPFSISIPRKPYDKMSSIEIDSAKTSSIAAITGIALSRSNKAAEAQSLIADNADDESPLWLAAHSEVSVKLGTTAAALDYADRALQHSHSDPFLFTLSIMRSINEERLIPEIALASLTKANQQGDSSRLLFNLYFEISRNADISFPQFAPLVKQGILIYPDIKYAEELNRMETERILKNK